MMFIGKAVTDEEITTADGPPVHTTTSIELVIGDEGPLLLISEKRSCPPSPIFSVSNVRCQGMALAALKRLLEQELNQ
jgi:hypothetical protein